MYLLEILKFTKESLQGTEYESLLVNLQIWFHVAVLLIIIFHLLGHKFFDSVLKGIVRTWERLDRSMQYAPGAERIRVRFEPYISFPYYIFVFMASFFSTLIVAIAYAFNCVNLPLNVHVLVFIWCFVGFLFMRIGIAQASWAWEGIRARSA